jgi:hypothetical protein
MYFFLALLYSFLRSDCFFASALGLYILDVTGGKKASLSPVKPAISRMGIQAVIPESGPQGTHPLGAPIVANHKNTSFASDPYNRPGGCWAHRCESCLPSDRARQPATNRDF